MSFLLTCPNCGEREVTDFAYGGEVVPAAEGRALAARAEHLQLLPPQRRRSSARVVVSPLGLPGLVLGGARHDDQRGPVGRPPAAMSRLPPSPGERINRARTVSFEFDGKRVEAFEGDTVGSALQASGRRVLSRSFKYHRPRGLFCCAGQCPNCLVDVDGWPGVRACTEPVREGMRVSHMNASPSLEFDVMRRHRPVRQAFYPTGLLLQDVHPAAPPLAAVREGPAQGRRARPAGPPPGGPRVADGVPPPPRRRAGDRRRRRRLPPRFELRRSAPTWSWSTTAPSSAAPCSPARAPSARRELGARSRAAGVEVLAPAAALGFFDGIVPVWSQSTLHQIRADRHVAATGSIEQPLMFEGNDLPGVMLCSGARRLASLYRVSPGSKAVVATVGDCGSRRRSPWARPASVLAVADARARAGPRSSSRAWSGAYPALRGRGVVRALGRRRVEGAVSAISTEAGAGRRQREPDRVRSDRRLRRHHARDLTAAAGRGEARWDEARGAYLPDAAPPGIHTAGAVAGHAPTTRPSSRAPSPAPRRRSRSSSATTPTTTVCAPTARR